MTLNDPGFQVTEKALQHIRNFFKKTTPAPIALRIGVKKAGCSGYEYVLQGAYASQQCATDLVFSFEEVHVWIDTLIYRKFFQGGTVLDFQKQGLKEGLHFQNPNVAAQCGCGESFTLVQKKDEDARP